MTVESASPAFRPLIYWYLTLNCNLSCRHCWVESSPAIDQSSDLSPADCQAVLGKLPGINPGLITVTGGEPMVRQDLPDIIDGLAAAGLAFSIETNATMLPAGVLAALTRTKSLVYSFISVSLDGGTSVAHDWLRGSGAFDRTVANIKRLTGAGLRVGIQCILTPASIDSLPELFTLADPGSGFGVETLGLSIAYPTGRASTGELALPRTEWQRACSQITSLLDSYEGNLILKVPPAMIPPVYLTRLMHSERVDFLTSCAFPALGILPDGSLSICILTAQESGLSLGHVLTDDLPAVVNQHLVPLKTTYEAANLTGICADCVFRPTCRGGCRASAFSCLGAFDAPLPLCEALEQGGQFAAAYRASERSRLLNRAVETTR